MITGSPPSGPPPPPPSSAGQDVNDAWSFQHPELYVPGQTNLYFSKKAFFKCALHGGYSSLVLFFIPYAALYDTMRDDGRDIADYQSFALLTQTCLLFAVSIQVCWLSPVFVVRGKTMTPFLESTLSLSAVGAGDVILDSGEHFVSVGKSGHVLRRHVHHVQ